MSVRDFCNCPLTSTVSRVSKIPTTCFSSPFLNKNLSLPKTHLTSNFLLSIEKSNTSYLHNRSQFVPKSSDGDVSTVEDEIIDEEGIESVYSDDEDNIDSLEIEELEREAREAVREYSMSLAREKIDDETIDERKKGRKKKRESISSRKL
ncbi:hypothetical protein MKW94_005654, partial [Papaver nudicaule]|nr:hypothetical protein [Papaver nudicaule]